jgi:SAM-dependent methyltransferase
MSNWQERITRETAPAIQVEHELRYRVAAPLISTSAAWADLGCGNGLAAALALGETRPPRIVLVDVEENVVARAAAELGAADARRLAGDLTSTEDLQRIGQELREPGGETVVTCFEVLEHLETFLPLLEWSGRLAREHGVTFVISVPNDAFWSIENPHHRTAWGEGAFAELGGLLPTERTMLRQVALAGSAMAAWDGRDEQHDLTVAVGGEQLVATHFIAAFGPRHAELRPAVLAVMTDVSEQRRWERQRDSNLALLQQALHERDVWFEEWRRYIHQLERELDLPLSGISEGQLPDHGERPA